MSVRFDLPRANALKALSSVRLTVPHFKGELRGFQRVGVGWMVFVPRGLLLDSCGLGKTIEALALLSLLKEKQALDQALIVVPSNESLLQWLGEVRRFTRLSAFGAVGNKTERVEAYLQPSDLTFATYELLHHDFDYLRELKANVIIFDEIAAVKNRDTATADLARRLTRQECVERVYGLTATPVQNTLLDLYSIIEVLGLPIFDSFYSFRQRYVTEEVVTTVRKGRRRNYIKVTGYRNMGELKNIISPFFIRRRIVDVEPELPDVVVERKFVTLTSVQKKLYDKLRRQVFEFGMSREWSKVRRSMHSLQQACDATTAFLRLPERWFDGTESSKIDYIMDLLTGDLEGEKVVVFSRYKAALVELKNRLQRVGIKFVVITGDVPKGDRIAWLKAFQTDPTVKVLLGTQAIELSLNLQAARCLIMMNLLYNPTRVEQIIGRLRRIGSKHKTVLVLQLFAAGTLEHRVLDLLSKKQALPDYLFEEQSDLFDKLSNEELMLLIRE